MNGAIVQSLIDPVEFPTLFGIDANDTLVGINGEVISIFEKRFNFTLQLLPYPGSYGVLMKNKSWNGFMKYLTSKIPGCKIQDVSTSILIAVIAIFE